MEFLSSLISMSAHMGSRPPLGTRPSPSSPDPPSLLPMLVSSMSPVDPFSPRHVRDGGVKYECTLICVLAINILVFVLIYVYMYTSINIDMYLH